MTASLPAIDEPKTQQPGGLGSLAKRLSRVWTREEWRGKNGLFLAPPPSVTEL